MILAVILLFSAPVFSNTIYTDGPPRFKQYVRTVHEVFLGDSVKLKCPAQSKPAPNVTWYRNGNEFKPDLNVQIDKKHMTLEVRRIDVTHQGDWSCLVYNNLGSIRRNFTIEIIDFCDFYLFYGRPEHVPMECVCVWAYSREKGRPDVDQRVATESLCRPYVPSIDRRMRKPFRELPCPDPPCPRSGHHVVARPVDPVRLFDWLSSNPRADVASLLPQLGARLDHRMRDGLADWPWLSREEKRMRARRLVAESMRDARRREDDDDDEDEDDDEDDEDSTTKYPESQDDEQAPRFDDNEPYKVVVTPAGRTIKLSCKASGNPPAQYLWRKNGVVLFEETIRSTGVDYKFIKGTMEIEDATSSDTGLYKCEAYNPRGHIEKHFNVTVISRIRSVPIIMPNILVNQTVNVNGTANFTCQVFSDLLPHIMWVKLERNNDGGFLFYNETSRKNVFHFTEMETVEHARILLEGDRSTLTLHNVGLDDQGTYACITGNSLGKVMANATLTVNEFLSHTILTGHPDPGYSTSSLILLAIFCVLLTILLVLCLAYYMCLRANRKRIQNMEEHVGLMPKKKRVVVTKSRPDGDRDGWSDLPSTYHIQIIEQNTGQGGRRARLSSDLTLLSDYQIDPDPEWEVDRGRLNLLDILGEGAFGEVWKGMLKAEPAETATEREAAEYPVAVKKLKASAHEKELIDLVSEMETFKIIGHHENLLRLIGCCTGDGPLYVILELCTHGNLRDFLRAHRPRDEKDAAKAEIPEDYLEPRKANEAPKQLIKHLTQRHLVQFAWQVAKGMAFMASRKIIHRDLAARNVLVADDFVMKISDFGLSRDVHYNDYYRKKGNGRLPIKWMALEALDSHVYTIESDVWSFGILLWEIMTLGGTPYPTIAMPQLYSCLKEGYRMEAPHNCPEEIYSLMVACWQEKRENRPNFETIVNYLDWMLTQADDGNADTEVETRSGSSDDVASTAPPAPSNDGSLGRPKRARPLSAPVFFPQNHVDEEHDAEFSPGPESAGIESIGAESAIGSTAPGPSELAPYPPDSAIGSPLYYSGHASIDSTQSGSPSRPAPPPLSHYYMNMPQQQHKSRFPFPPDDPPNRQTRLSDSTDYEVPKASHRLGKERRLSAGSQSSGHGGSSAMSSAEGLGIAEFCTLQYLPQRMPNQ